MAYRADVPVLLASTTLGSDTATVNLTGIPSGYTNIEILVSVRSSAGAAQGAMDFAQMRFNSDTASNYGAGTSAGSQITVIRPITAVNWLTAAWSSGKIMIWDYASTTKHKYVHYNTTYNNSTTGFNSVNYMDDAGVWKSTTAVTSVQFTLASGANYVTGSTFRIYGYP